MSRVSELPLAFKPSIVTLSAPFKSIKCVASVPETVRAPTGLTTTLVYKAEPVPLAFNVAVTGSTVSQVTETLMLPWWMPALMAAKAEPTSR